MKITERTSIVIGKKAKKRLAEMQIKLRFKGCKDRATSPGKLVAKLIMMEGAFEYLEKEYFENK